MSLPSNWIYHVSCLLVLLQRYTRPVAVHRQRTLAYMVLILSWKPAVEKKWEYTGTIINKVVV